MKYVGCVHLYIPWKFGERGSTPRGATGPSLSFFVCPSRYDARHRKPRRFVYALNLGGTGMSPRTVLVLVLVLVFVFVLVLQQAATYSIAAVAGNWTILVSFLDYRPKPRWRIQLSIHYSNKLAFNHWPKIHSISNSWHQPPFRQFLAG